MTKTKLSVAILAVFTTLFIGCGDSDVDYTLVPQAARTSMVPAPTITPTTSPTPEPEESFLRVVHTYYLVPDLELTIDDGEPRSLEQVQSTEYLTLTPGEHTVEISDADSESMEGASTVVDLADGEYTTVLPLPQSPPSRSITAQMEEFGGSEVLFLELEDDVTPDAGTLNIRFVHASFTQSDAELRTDEGANIIGPLARNQATEYETVDPDLLSAAEFLFAAFTSENFTIEFQSLENSSDELVGTLAQELTNGGVNTTVILTVRGEGQPVLVFLFDEADDGSRSLISVGEFTD